MRVLVATSQWFPDFMGGSARIATGTAEQLAAQGHEVTVIVPRHPGKPEHIKDNGLTLLRTLPRNAMPQTLTDVIGAWRGARALRNERFDVVLAHHTPVALGLLSARIKAPMALVYHASAVRELQFLRHRLPRSRRRLAHYPLEALLAGLEWVAVKRAQRILVLSEFSRSLLVADHPTSAERVVQVLGGVDVNRFAPMDDARTRLNVPPDALLLVTARRLEPRMGIEELLLALTHLPTVMLVVIGKGMSEDPLRRLAARLELDSRVQFVGRVDDENLRAWYAAADVVVMPTAAYEGFGVVTAEALACGTPVVATAVGASPELLDELDPRLVAQDGTAVGLADALSKAIAATGSDFRARCRDYAVRRFAWEVVIEGWVEALELIATSVEDGIIAAAQRSSS